MPTEMLAGVYEGVGRLELKYVPQPELREDTDIKIRVTAVGICGTDLHILSDPPTYPAKEGTILGHEIVGEIVEAGNAVRHVKVGDQVAINPNDYCGTCARCRHNEPNLCSAITAIGIDADGAFAEYWAGPSRLAFLVPSEVPPEAGAFAEMLADVLNGLRRIDLVSVTSAFIIGLGPIGHLFARVLRSSGVPVIVGTERNPYRVERARNAGMSVLEGDAQRIADAVADATGQQGADLVIDATGNGLDLAVEVARKGGTILVFGVNTSARTSFPQQLITTKELRVEGAWLANATFPMAIEMLRSGRIEVTDLVSHVFPLEDVHDALGVLRGKQAQKVVIKASHR